MSIQSEINRISGNIADSLTEVQNKGVTVPAGSNSDDLPGLIALITTGSGSVVDEVTQLQGGGDWHNVTGTDLTLDTVTAGSMLSGVTAHDSAGNAIIGTIATKTSSDLTASGATVTVPAGYYASSRSKSVSTMTLPTAASSTSSGTSKATISRSTSDQYINIPTGYNSSAAYYKVSAVANGSATTPATTITANPTISVNSSGLITATTSATKSVTPTVSAGYVSSGTAGTITVSGSATSQLTTKAAATITPGTTSQTIASGTYLTGTQTIAGDADLIADNIKKDVEIFGVTGTFEGASEPNLTAKTITPTEEKQIIFPNDYTETLVSQTVSNLTTMTEVNENTTWTGRMTIVSGQTSTITTYPNKYHIYMRFKSQVYVGGSQPYLKPQYGNFTIDEIVTLPSANYSVSVPVSDNWVGSITLTPYSTSSINVTVTFKTTVSNAYVGLRSDSTTWSNDSGWSSNTYNAFRFYLAESETDYDGFRKVTVNAIPSTYIPQRNIQASKSIALTTSPTTITPDNHDVPDTKYYDSATYFSGGINVTVASGNTSGNVYDSSLSLSEYFSTSEGNSGNRYFKVNWKVYLNSTLTATGSFDEVVACANTMTFTTTFGTGNYAAHITINAYSNYFSVVRTSTTNEYTYNISFVAYTVKSEPYVAMSEVVATFEGGGNPTPITKKQINFVDYDGTLIDSYTSAEWTNVTTLPSNPSHTGLTAQGWNWTKAQIDAQLTAMPTNDIWIGQMYVTTSGATEIDVVFSEARLEPILTLAVNGTVSVDWGDNTSATTSTGTSLVVRKALNHTYASEGSYTIKISVTSGSFQFYGGSSYQLLRKNTTANQNRVYTNCVKAIRFGTGVTSIGMNGIEYCNSLEYVTVPNTITSFSSNAFGYCYNLKCLVIPSGTTTTETSMFASCYSLKTVSFPSTMTTIGSSTFSGCMSLKNVIIPNGVTTLSTSVFNGCQSIENIILPNTITSMGGTMFQSCYALKNIVMPNNITDIGTSSISYCYCLSNFTIPNNVTEIKASAFTNCFGLSSITIPSNVTTIGNSAFSSCYGMAEYHFLSTTPPSLGTGVFNAIVSDCKIYVPSASLTDYQEAENWSTYASYMVGE